MIAGQGTIGLEILDQVKNIDAVIVPVGGGGLIVGIALAVKTLKPEIQIIVNQGSIDVHNVYFIGCGIGKLRIIPKCFPRQQICD